MCEKPDSNLYCSGCVTERLFKRAAEACLCSYPVSKGTGLKAQFAPTESNWVGRSEGIRNVAQQREFSAPAWCSQQAEGYTKQRFETVSTERAVA